MDCFKIALIYEMNFLGQKNIEYATTIESKKRKVKKINPKNKSKLYLEFNVCLEKFNQKYP